MHIDGQDTVDRRLVLEGEGGGDDDELRLLPLPLPSPLLYDVRKLTLSSVLIQNANILASQAR